MKHAALVAHRNYFRMVHAVTVRAIGTLADEDLDFRPREGMRSPRELVFHIYAQEQIIADAITGGRYTAEAARASNPEDELAAPVLARLRTVADLQEWARASHAAADRVADAMDDETLARPLPSPFGNFPTSQFFLFIYDEHWHHRGQLYTYLRLLCKEPPGLYDYGS